MIFISMMGMTGFDESSYFCNANSIIDLST